MKITCNTTPPKPSHPSYPWIGQNPSNGSVCLFTAAGMGTVLKTSNQTYKVGDIFYDGYWEVYYIPISSVTLTQEF